MISDTDVARVALALDRTPTRAYTTPIVYPWAVQHFVPRPLADRPWPAPGPQRLYVHIPFCRYHCTFCFYAVRIGAGRDQMERYVATLGRELQWVPQGTPLARLIVGGGTPTALSPELLRRLLSTIFEWMPSAASSARTIEASPDSLSDDHIRVLHDCRIGRVSIGIETLDGSVLDTVHRRHSPTEALTACRKVTDSGLALNVDLIYGLPGQTEDSVRRDIEAVAETGAATLCLYGLRLNERTVVAAQLAAEEHLDLARLIRWRAFVRHAAEAAGFVQTRCYAFKRPGAEPSWHERSATEGLTSEIGIGMSARSQLGCAVYRNHDSTDVYIQRVEQGLSPVETVFDLDSDDLKTQFVAGRLANGRALERRAYAEKFGVSIDVDFESVLERLASGGLIDDDGDRLVLTAMGKLVYDRVLLCFYPERARVWLRNKRR